MVLKKYLLCYARLTVLSFFKLISFAGGQGGPNDQDIVVSTPLYNLHIMKNFISHISEKTSPDFGIQDFKEMPQLFIQTCYRSVTSLILISGEFCAIATQLEVCGMPGSNFTAIFVRSRAPDSRQVCGNCDYEKMILATIEIFLASFSWMLRSIFHKMTCVSSIYHLGCGALGISFKLCGRTLYTGQGRLCRLFLDAFPG